MARMTAHFIAVVFALSATATVLTTSWIIQAVDAGTGPGGMGFYQ